MSDKLKSGVSVDISFVAGETPSPAKLTAITAQTRYAVAKCETAIGDTLGESYPYTSAADTTLSQAWGKNLTTGGTLSGAEERKLDIVNIARLIGPASNLNPKTLSGDVTITEDVPVGVHEFSLKYPVSGALAAVSCTDPGFTLQRADHRTLQSAGDWSVTRLGKVFCATETVGGTITYVTNSREWNGGYGYQGSSFNVIPDPNQSANGNGCSIGSLDGQGRRLVTLPAITHQQTNIAHTSIALDEDDVNYNEIPLLPKVLRDNLSTGDEIPKGFLYLKNETTGYVYTDGVYYYNDSDSYYVANVDLDDVLTDTFSTLTVGTDITTSIDDLRDKQNHSHDRTHGEPFVDISGISGQLEGESASGFFVPSDRPGNHFPQYLHRDGMRGGFDQNFNDENCMRGDLVLGVSGGTPGNYLSGTGESYGIYFGDLNSTNPHILKEGTEDLEIFNGDGEIVLRTTALADKVVAEPVVQVEKGIIGTTIGTVGLLSNGLAPYATEGTFNSGSKIGVGSEAISLGLTGDITTKTWYSVDVAIKLTTSDRWIKPNYINTGSDIFESTAGTAFNYGVYWKETGGVSTVYVAMPGSYWPNTTVLDYRVVIWYQP